MHRPFSGVGLGLVVSILIADPARADGPKPDDPAFFEAKIRPVLVAHCYACHSAEAAANKKLKGGLRADTREGLRTGGDGGPAIVPGGAEESLLVEAIRYDGLQMPPKGKLPDAVIADFVAWIDAGAADPRDGVPATTAKPAIDLEAGRQFWAYRPPEAVAPPAVKDAAWPLGPIDAFHLAEMESAGLHPSAEADRGTLLRRLSFDLVGLPPTPEELAEFSADPSPLAYERQVDRLLASPRFGERWARHWLDVARYAESLTLRGFVLKDAWRYRDYVIDAFNRDLPYDQFVREQVAGDLLTGGDLGERRRHRVATTFLMLGNTNLEEQDKAQLDMDVVDEQLDTIGKAFLAQTIGCARCHDHKFDPIPTRDYYAMAGILRNAKALEHANVSKWLDVPLPVSEEREAELKRHETAVAALEARIKGAKAKGAQAAVASAKGVVSAADLPGIVVDDSKARKVGAWKASRFSGSYIGDGYVHDDNAEKGEKTLTFPADVPEAGVYDVWLAYSSGGSRSESVPVTILSADGEATVTVDMRAAPPLEGRFVALGRFRFEKNGQGYVMLSNEETRGHVTADAVMFLPSGRDESGAVPPKPEVPGNDDVKALEAELRRLKSAGPVRETAISVVERPEIADLKIHIRGSVHTLGEIAPRGVLGVATLGEPPAMPSDTSGRREMADWLAGQGNPLTDRVIVNRVWHWLMGEGLVRTVDNFGTTGEPPSHPELLDALALDFAREGRSLKDLARRVVLSRAYRQESLASDAARSIDPENRLHSRANRRRLEAECLRDAMLAASGDLRPDMGGPTFPADLKEDYGYPQKDTRRSVYAPAFRNAPPEALSAFDLPDPSLVVGRRDVSTVAPQALFLMNSPFVRERARRLMTRLLAEWPGDDRRIDRAFLLVLGRTPTAAERAIAREAVADDGPTPESDRWTSLIQALFASIDFRYVD